ncbi:MAG: DUF5946 family protein, partial [Cyanobacteria bacterium J06638_22]
LSTTGVTHAYLDASPGCWARYSEVLAREYSQAQYFAVHAITVDAYAIQHPGTESSQTINSVNLHLASLYAYYRNHVEMGQLSQLKHYLAQRKDRFRWLPPPAHLGNITINTIWQADTAEQHCESVLQWGESVFNCWCDYHDYIKDICS